MIENKAFGNSFHLISLLRYIFFSIWNGLIFLSQHNGLVQREERHEHIDVYVSGNIGANPVLILKRNYMASIEKGKKEIVEWIKNNYKAKSSCLDVGACDGKWSDLLEGYMEIDAVEIFKPYIKQYGLSNKYNNVYNENIVGMEYKPYDLIIFGDIIEHLKIEEAKAVIEYAKGKCKDMIVAVPFEYEQDEIDGNIYQKHLQPDLTFETFEERYKGFEIIYYDIEKRYAYYHEKHS